jgi:hypothetical protein
MMRHAGVVYLADVLPRRLKFRLRTQLERAAALCAKGRGFAHVEDTFRVA